MTPLGPEAVLDVDGTLRISRYAERAALDATERTAWFRVNSGVWNGSASNDPAMGVGGYPIGGTFPLFPAVCSDVASMWTADFSGPFRADAPDGFIPWSQGSLQISLGDCADVDLAGAKAGDMLKLSATGVWKPSSVASCRLHNAR
ncbi:hypothetical protein [Burkholderia ubonensis]|nr:hypothetical protein [Burkholderia ubonensis]